MVSIDVFPSDTFYNIYATGTPIIITVSVAGIFAFTVVIFLLYNRLVEARQNLVMRKAAQTNAMVTSLFPAQVSAPLRPCRA